MGEGRGREGGWGHKRQAVTLSVWCPPYILSHVSRAVIMMWSCMWRFYADGSVVFFFLPSRWDHFSAPFCQFGMSVQRNTHHAQQNPRLLLRFSWINHKQLQAIICSRYFSHILDAVAIVSGILQLCLLFHLLWMKSHIPVTQVCFCFVFVCQAGP